MNLRVTSLGLIKNLTDEVDWMLYLIGVSNFLMLNDDSCANDARSGSNIDQYSFIWLRRCHDWRLR